MFKIDEWVGIKGLTFEYNGFNISVFCRALQNFKLRNHKWHTRDTLKELLFDIKRNQRTLITKWDIDITFLGFTWQFQQYE